MLYWNCRVQGLTTMKVCNSKGQFVRLAPELRRVQTMRLTPTCWNKLGETADKAGVTRADLIEYLVKAGLIDALVDRETLSSLLQELLDSFVSASYDSNPYKIAPRDKSVLKRLVKPLLFHLCLHLNLSQVLPDNPLFLKPAVTSTNSEVSHG